MAARASRTENQDAIDAAIVGMLADPKEVNTILENYKKEKPQKKIQVLIKKL